MPTPPSPQYEAAVALLADREWHDYAEVVRKVAATVPPGIAMRRAEAQRLSRARAGGFRTPETRRRPRTTERLIDIGSKSIARQVLQNKNVFQIDPEGSIKGGIDRRIRLRARGDDG